MIIISLGVSANWLSNIWGLDKEVSHSNHHGNESYDRILEAIANELVIQRENYPMNIIHLKLLYCRNVYGLFERILNDKK